MSVCEIIHPDLPKLDYKPRPTGSGTESYFDIAFSSMVTPKKLVMESLEYGHMREALD
jgi:hypothetical protein